MRTIATVFLAVLVLATVVPPASAQSSHTAPTAALERAAHEHVAASAADRDVVMQLLSRPEVRTIATEAGIDLRRVERAVSTLEGSDLSALASEARRTEQALAGGQSTVVISTTMIIIGLLILILIIVAVD